MVRAIVGACWGDEGKGKIPTSRAQRMRWWGWYWEYKNYNRILHKLYCFYFIFQL